MVATKVTIVSTLWFIVSFRFRASPGVAPMYDNKYQRTRVRMHIYGGTSANFVEDFINSIVCHDYKKREKQTV